MLMGIWSEGVTALGGDVPGASPAPQQARQLDAPVGCRGCPGFSHAAGTWQGPGLGELSEGRVGSCAGTMARAGAHVMGGKVWDRVEPC